MDALWGLFSTATWSTVYTSCVTLRLDPPEGPLGRIRPVPPLPRTWTIVGVVSVRVQHLQKGTSSESLLRDI